MNLWGSIFHSTPFANEKEIAWKWDGLHIISTSFHESKNYFGKTFTINLSFMNKKLDLTAYETLRLTGSQCLLSNMYQIVQIRWHRPLAHNANFLHGWLPSNTPETHNKKVTHKPNHLHDLCMIDLINFLWSIAFNNIFQVISYCFREGSLIALKHIETT